MVIQAVLTTPGTKPGTQRFTSTMIFSANWGHFQRFALETGFFGAPLSLRPQRPAPLANFL
jgi:hypothetical protein